MQARFYAHFAEHLADRGHAVLVTDPPYVGTSWPKGVDHTDASAKKRALKRAGMKATFSKTWVGAIEASLELLHQRYPSAQLVYVGHSNGGHLLSLCTRTRHLVKRALFVSAATPFMEYYADPEASYFGMDTMLEQARKLGHYPASEIAMGDDLPAGMGAEWQKWFRVPKCAFVLKLIVLTHTDLAQYHPWECSTLQTRILSIFAEDDPISSHERIDRALYDLSIADCTRLAIDTEGQGWGSIGHIGAFRPTHRNTLWKLVMIPWIEEEIIADRYGQRHDTRELHRGHYGSSRFRELVEKGAIAKL